MLKHRIKSQNEITLAMWHSHLDSYTTVVGEMAGLHLVMKTVQGTPSFTCIVEKQKKTTWETTGENNDGSIEGHAPSNF